MMQTDVNAVFLHKLFGINADFPFFSRQLIHPTKAGIMIAAAHSKTIFSARRIFDGLSVMVL